MTNKEIEAMKGAADLLRELGAEDREAYYKLCEAIDKANGLETHAEGTGEANANKSKHTPGPWIISSDGKAVRSGADIMANYRRNVANVGKRDNVEEMAANLALIAAAPELLAALEDALNCMEILAHEMGKWESVKASEGFKSARAAIAKARGGK